MLVPTMCLLHALADRPDATAARPHIEVEIAGAPEDISAFRAAIELRVTRTGVDVVATEVAEIETTAVLSENPDSPGYLARAWIDLRMQNRYHLYLVPARSPRVLVRSVPVERRAGGGVDAVAQAQLAEILSTAIESVQAGAPIGVPRSEVSMATPAASTPPGPASVQAVAQVPPAPRVWDAGAFVQSSAWSSRHAFVPGAGLSVLTERPGSPLTMAIWLSATYNRAFDVDAAAAGLRLSSAGANATLLLRTAVGHRAAAGVGLGAGAEFRSVDPRDPVGAPGIEGPQRQRDLVLQLRWAARIDAYFPGRTSGFCAAVLDTPALQARYVIESAGERLPVFTPWRIRPALMAGLSFTLP